MELSSLLFKLQKETEVLICNRMSSNLFDVYSYLEEKYNNLGVLYNKPISYLTTLIENLDKKDFVFVYKETNSSELPECIITKPKDSDDLNRTGSPLKDICNIESFDISLEAFPKSPWGQHEERYCGISVNQARNLLSDSVLQKLGKNATGSVWILCDASDREKIILLNLHFGEGRNCRSRVTYNGILAPQKVEFSEISKIHDSSIHGSSKTEIYVESFFIIKSNLTLKLSCNYSQGASLDNYRNCEALLKQTVVVKGTGSVADDFWIHLDVLSTIKDYIIGYKESEGLSEPVYNCGRGIDTEDLFERITLIMTELPCFYDTEESIHSCEIEEVIKRVKLREPMDITNKLWDILRRCSCYKDLQRALGIVFQCAASCNILNIPNNKNRVAEIIREVQQQRLAIPSLTGSEPLELLLEIGLEKLVKDYESIFVESKICGLNDLREYFLYNDENTSDGKLTDHKRKTFLSKNNLNETYPQYLGMGLQNSNFNQKKVEYTLGRLAQIQLALEHLLLIQAKLNLENVNNQIFKELMGRNPRSLDEIFCAVYDEIQIPITVGEVLHELENKYPDQRKIVIISKNKFKKLQSTFYYSTEYIFPPNCFNLPEEIAANAKMYHWWHVLKITT